MKIRILYVVSTLRNSGPTNQLLGIIKGLDREKYCPTVLTLAAESNEDSRLSDFENAKINVDSLKLSRKEFILIGRNKLIKYINNYNPDIIHTSGVRADSAVSKCHYSRIHVMTIRNFAKEDYVSKFGSPIGAILAKQNINAMKRSQYVVTCSKALKTLYSAILKVSVRSIQNGVDTTKYYPISSIAEQSSLREKLKLPKHKKIFLMVGSLIERKDPILVINAFKKAKIEEGVLVILGDGPLMNQIETIINDDIILCGNVNNVTEYLRACDYYVSASKSEGLPNSVLEAGSCGIQMILTDIPQHLEVFEDHLSLIRLFKTGNVEELKNHFIDSINSNNKTDKEVISNYIKERFDNDIMSHKYQELYDEILIKTYDEV